MSIPFIDCQGLAGAWTLGTVQTGDFELIHRTSLPGGFGDDSVSANRPLLTGDTEFAMEEGQQHEWSGGHTVGYLCGTPPCSGFSLLNTSKKANARGVESAINSCMRDLVKYAARNHGLDGEYGPEIVSFESVQQAYSMGRPLMQALRVQLERDTGQQYALTHVKVSGSAIGSAQMRHRYYPVFHRIPFRVENPERKRVVTYRDAIGDLSGAKRIREEQPYPAGNGYISDFALDKRRDDGVFGDNLGVDDERKLNLLLRELAPYWLPGESIHPALRRFGRKPEAMRESGWLGIDVPGDPMTAKVHAKGWSWPYRIHPDQPGRVITGGGIMSFIHWDEMRLLTVREIARLMGYPDDWSWSFIKSAMHGSLLIGKCCPVQSGKWISTWVARAIHEAYADGTNSLYEFESNGDVVALEDGESEYLHDHTNIYKPWLKEQELTKEVFTYTGT